ncbi:beta-glucosidase [Spirochaeta cellobiosiphila]|uniref:beta-glucosidase n=1 Tax=Spirochaeta cellobiosiphila TaxID=504483 RepID=UPI00042093CE|nr:glycoside hydrolase family 3 C-terminal domain-containing protein [Spirochaeta cellobiosiphila]
MKYKEIIDQMTLEEKASLMSGKDFWQSQDIPRLNIPNLFLSDGPHGLRKQAVAADHLGLNESLPATCFPTAATLANSWNEDLGEQIGQALGEEALSQKVNVLLGPGINIKRNPLCGRNFEYFSEDPYLAGKLSSSMIRGIQSQGVSACVKHFSVNNQEMNRMTIDTIVDERTLREIYLTAFEMAVKEGQVKSLMSSYNKLNGFYTNENLHLMQDILRIDWNYDGCVITDWGGSNDRVEGLRAGNELEMPTTGGETDRDIVLAIKEGKIEESILDEAVNRLLTLTYDTNKALSDRDVTVDIEQHHKLAQTAAEESIVLLKNEGDILPLKENTSVAVIGDFADVPRYQGAGSSIVNPTKLDSFLDLIPSSSLNYVGYARGFKRYGGTSNALIRKACQLAKKADKVILFIGLDEYSEVEGLDRPNMKLPQNQIDLLHELSQVNKNIIIVLSSGSAVEMPWINKASGVLHAYLSGQAGAGAILNVITGQVNPSGKLAESYPFQYEDVSSRSNFPGMENSVEYREGLFVGYRYYDTSNTPVLFPFGYGLSYTQFKYEDLKLSQTSVSFTLSNTGLVKGSEISQLYIKGPSDQIFRPSKELKGFSKNHLEPGQSINITIPLDDKAFRYFNVKTQTWEIESGSYTIMIGSSSADIQLLDKIEITGTDAPSPYKKENLPSYFNGKVANVGDAEYEELLIEPRPDTLWNRKKALGYNDTIAQCQYAKSWVARLSFRLIIFAHWFLKCIGQRATANLIIMSVYHMPFRGIARMTGGIFSLPMIDGLLMVVNGHFFKGFNHFFKEKKKLKKAHK